MTDLSERLIGFIAPLDGIKQPLARELLNQGELCAVACWLVNVVECHTGGPRRLPPPDRIGRGSPRSRTLLMP
jgi:hypothetical protein